MLILKLEALPFFLLFFAFSGAQDSQTYHITRTWDNKTTTDGANITVTLTSSILSPTSERQLTILVEAPFYNDPHLNDSIPPETMPGLWDWEVVEVFLLGSDEHYLEIELSPKSQYLLLELKGYRNVIRDKMPLYKAHYNATINGNRWSGIAVIPNCYLPTSITKFNAYAIHGTDPDRIYMSLFPTAEGEFPEPDFHRLTHFGDIDFQNILPPTGTGPMTEITIPMAETSQTHHITRTWDNKTTTDGANITVTLTSSILSPSSERQLTILVEAPFYNDPHLNDSIPPETMPGLWDWEVVEVFLLGSDEHYLEIELSPKSQYLLLELKGYRNVIRDKMPLYKAHYNATINGNRWSGIAVIPNCYLPTSITKFNAYAIHGTDPDRIYMSLFPTAEGEFPEPDFHRLTHFGDIDFQNILPDPVTGTEPITETTQPMTETTTSGGNAGNGRSMLPISVFSVILCNSLGRYL